VCRHADLGHSSLLSHGLSDRVPATNDSDQLPVNDLGGPDEGTDRSMGGRRHRGWIGRADGRRAGAGVCGPACAARRRDELGSRRRLPERGEFGRTGPGLRSCLPAAREPHGLAVPGGGPGAGTERHRGPVRAACRARGPRILAGGPGRRLAVQLGVRDSGRDAGLSAAAVSERAAAFAAVAPGGVVRGSRVHVSRADLDRPCHPVLGTPVPPVPRRAVSVGADRDSHPATHHVCDRASPRSWFGSPFRRGTSGCS
jgi:hypothetical protein